MKTNNIMIKIIGLFFIFTSTLFAGYIIKNANEKHSLSVVSENAPNTPLKLVKNQIVSSGTVSAKASMFWCTILF